MDNSLTIFVTLDGDVYYGSLNALGYPAGPGTLIYKNGDNYCGQWENGAPHGIGKVFYKNGDVYHGYFVSGNMFGKGRYTFVNGSIFEGEYSHETKEGNGKLIKGEKTYFATVNNQQLCGDSCVVT